MADNDNTISLIYILVTFVLMIIALCYYLYYSGLQSRECKTMTEVYGTLNGRIQSVDPSQAEYKYPLRDYYIKSAYNCCSGGSYRNDYVDICSLKALLKQGVRGLDFEIFSIEDQPVVATSTGDSYYVKETFNYVAFADVLSVLANYAFASSTAPNPQDPILIHLRIKSANNKMFQNFAKLLESYYNLMMGPAYSFENNGKNFGLTPLADVMGKIVIIVDKSNTAFMECTDFYEYVNMTSNSVFMRALHYYDIQYTPDMYELIEFNKQNMTIGMPDKGSNPANPSSIVMREMGCQMLAMRYQLIESNSEENDILFDEAGHAFILKPEKLRYIPITVDAPEPQDPKLSYATRTIESDYYKFEI